MGFATGNMDFYKSSIYGIFIFKKIINPFWVSNTNVKIKVFNNAIVMASHAKLLPDVSEFVGDIEA